MSKRCEYVWQTSSPAAFVAAYGEIGLNIGYAYSQLELILVLKVGDQQLGGPFHGFARDVERIKNPKFEYNPRYPHLHFENYDQLVEAIEFGVELFQRIKKQIDSVGFVR